MSRVKELETDLKKSLKMVEELAFSIEHMRKEQVRWKNKVNEIRNALKPFQSTQIVSVSDHAVLRYIERVLGVKVEDIRAKLKGLTADGNGAYTVDGVEYVSKGGTLVTVVKK